MVDTVESDWCSAN